MKISARELDHLIKEEINEIFGFGKSAPSKEYPASELSTLIRGLDDASRMAGAELQASQREAIVDELIGVLEDQGFVIKENERLYTGEEDVMVTHQNAPKLKVFLDTVAQKNPKVFKQLLGLFNRSALDISAVVKDITPRAPSATDPEDDEDLKATTVVPPVAGPTPDEDDEDLTSTVVVPPVAGPTPEDDEDLTSTVVVPPVEPPPEEEEDYIDDIERVTDDTPGQDAPVEMDFDDASEFNKFFLTLNDQSMKALVEPGGEKAVPRVPLVGALMGADDATKSRFYDFMSPRAQEYLEDDQEVMSGPGGRPVGPEDIHRYQQEVLKFARDMDFAEEDYSGHLEIGDIVRFTEDIKIGDDVGWSEIHKAGDYRVTSLEANGDLLLQLDGSDDPAISTTLAIIVDNPEFFKIITAAPTGEEDYNLNEHKEFDRMKVLAGIR